MNDVKYELTITMPRIVMDGMDFYLTMEHLCEMMRDKFEMWENVVSSLSFRMFRSKINSKH